MKYGDEISLIRRLLEVDQTTFAKMLGVSFETVNRWELNKIDIDDNNLNNILTCAYDNNIYVNEIYEQFIVESYEYGDDVVLFHGSKDKLILPVDFKHSKKHNDFGDGFYLGERLDQAGMFVCKNENPRAYAFKLNLKNLKILEFNFGMDWLLAIMYYRNEIKIDKKNKFIKELINKIEETDVIRAPIADNRMFKIMDEFTKGNINSKQCMHALSAINLGKQYVLKSKKALNNLEYIKEFYISSKEKEKYIKDGIKLLKNSEGKVRASFINYSRDGKYIWEILK